MNILAPVSSMESEKALIEAGAKEIYLGCDDGLYNTYSFTGRGKVAPGNIKVLSDISEVKDMISYAHDHGVQVSFLGNTPYFFNGIFQNKRIEEYYFEYIEKGIDAGADAIVIGDVGLLYEFSKRRYPVKLHASIYLRTINYEQIKWLSSINVNRVTLSYQIMMSEIERICQEDRMEIEVVGYLGCSFFNGACSFLHAYGEGVNNEFIPGVTCKGDFIINDGSSTSKAKLFDCEAVCAFCRLRELERVGVKALKIVGRDRDYNNNKKIIQLYNKALELYRSGCTCDEVREILPDYWKRLYCKKSSCKYSHNNPNFKYTIGSISGENRI